MEFTLQSDNVQVTLKEEKQRYDTYNSRFEEESRDENRIKQPNTNNNLILSPVSQNEMLDSSGNKLIRFEILLKLEDYYLINNIRLKGEMDDITIKKIKFQNVNTGLWESISYFNPDNKETTFKEKDSLSLFSVGLTQFIKIELTIKCSIELFGKKTSNKETSPLRFMKNMNGDDINKFVIGSNHNLSMHEINRNDAFKLNNDKKKIFNLNVDYSAVKTNSNNHNHSNDKITGRSKSNVAIHNITEDNIHIVNHRNNTKENEHSTICNKILNNKVKNIIVFSQYLYTIPNSTFLLTLLNLKNYFKNNIKLDKMVIKNNSSISKGHENYLSALFLTASSMIQARLFIQAWELIHYLQIYIIKYTDVNNFLFFKILLEPNHIQTGNHMLLSLSSEQNEIRGKTPIFLTKLEIIKAVCIYEHGHILAFLDSLKNLINIYFLNDYSHINYKISWTKTNEIASDRNFIQNFLIENGKNLGEILITMIKDQSEIVTVSSLKIIEFILDYNPSVLIPYYSKILKYLLAFLYPKGSNENTKCLSIKNLPNLNSENQAVFTSYIKDFEDNKLFFPLDFFLHYQTIIDKSNKEKETSANTIKKEKNKNLPSISISNLSTFLMKQVNYTLDTLIDTIESLPQYEIINITIKINNILFNILKNNEIENVTAINITKTIRKLYENVNSSILELFFKSKKNGFMNNISASSPFNVPDYIFNLLFANLNSNPKIFNQFRDFFSPQQVKNPNKTGNLILPEINLIDNSETGILISFLFEKISDECFLFTEREYSLNLMIWISNTLEALSNFFSQSKKSQNESSNKTNLEDFSIFYAYHILFLLNNLYFSKSEIKQGLSKIFTTKMHPESISYLSKLITVLIRFEEVCLSNRKCIILFEPTIEIMKKIRMNYSSLFNVDYSSFFVEQYEKLYSFMSKTGIFSENIFYLLRTIQFINLNTDNSLFGDEKAKKVLQNIFTLVLQNFSIYYSDDMVELFNSLIFVLRDHMTEKIISDIITAIINKYNYKGQNFNLCCGKFFEVILRSKNYFGFMKNIILKAVDVYNENLLKNEGDIFKFKETHLEFLEKLEIYKKYLECLKNESYFEECLKNDKIEEFLKRHEELIFSERDSSNYFLNLAKTCNETVRIY